LPNSAEQTYPGIAVEQWENLSIPNYLWRASQIAGKRAFHGEHEPCERPACCEMFNKQQIPRATPALGMTRGVACNLRNAEETADSSGKTPPSE
jgi:hypothetical protein